jgi:hypothetical protein
VSAQPAAAGADFHELNEEFARSLRKFGELREAKEGGTR